MKNLLYLTLLLSITVLFSFSSINKSPSHSKSAEARFGTCSAPTGLGASKNGFTVTLTWTGSSSCHSYGGYYNYNDNMGSHVSNFGGGACTNPGLAYISVPTGTYSITYRVTAICGDGTSSTSAPFARNF